MFRLLKYLAERKPEKLESIKEHLEMMEWFEDLEVKAGTFGEGSLLIKDRYLDESLAYFDQRSANEGFLYLIFYLTLFIAEETPAFLPLKISSNLLIPACVGK